MDSTTTMPMPTATTVGPLISVGVILVTCACAIGCALVICVCARRLCCQNRGNHTQARERTQRAESMPTDSVEDYHLRVCNTQVGEFTTTDPPPPYTKADQYPNTDEQTEPLIHQQQSAESLDNPPPYPSELARTSL